MSFVMLLFWGSSMVDFRGISSVKICEAWNQQSDENQGK